MNKQRIQKLVKVIFATAIIYFVTIFTGSAFPLPNNAYLHIGDAAVLAMCLALPTPAAIFSAVIGSALADITLGAYNYIIATVIIKVVICIAAKYLLRLSDKPLVQDTFISGLGIVSVIGYFAADFITCLVTNGGAIASLKTAAGGIYAYILQALATAAVYLAVSAFVRRKSNDKSDDTEQI